MGGRAIKRVGGACLALACCIAVSASAQETRPSVAPAAKLSWYGDPSAPDISGVWVRAGVEGNSPSKEGWLPWPPPLKGKFAETWKQRVAEAAAGTRKDDPIRGCLPPGMPRYVTGMTTPMAMLLGSRIACRASLRMRPRRRRNEAASKAITRRPP